MTIIVCENQDKNKAMLQVAWTRGLRSDNGSIAFKPCLVLVGEVAVHATE
jgi:hypothetical protein